VVGRAAVAPPLNGPKLNADPGERGGVETEARGSSGGLPKAKEDAGGTGAAAPKVNMGRAGFDVAGGTGGPVGTLPKARAPLEAPVPDAGAGPNRLLPLSAGVEANANPPETVGRVRAAIGGLAEKSEPVVREASADAVVVEGAGKVVKSGWRSRTANPPNDAPPAVVGCSDPASRAAMRLSSAAKAGGRCENSSLGASGGEKGVAALSHVAVFAPCPAFDPAGLAAGWGVTGG
jgi:hypothetical protein